jgi:deoxyribodipyrimidine photo-lyase
MMDNSLFPDDKLQLSQVDWTPTRAAGLARLRAFVPSAGQAYARTRNTDFGPSQRNNVSGLSPYLARRMITEDEVVRAVLRAHSFSNAEKFVQEVFWRTYWKGWLEMRPSVLVQFNQQRLALKAQLSQDTDLAMRFNVAVNGQTGIDYFDAWVDELRTYGWLHNHARMWFASIWIFTLRLPWQLGADFFYKHLLDGDAASNTCSWRWVAGLHTKGKHYLARASNIAAHTNGRFDPMGQLNEHADAILEAYSVPGPMSLTNPSYASQDRVGLLVTSDDLNPASITFGAKIAGAAVLTLPLVSNVDSPSALFEAGAINDAQARIGEDFGVAVDEKKSAADIVNWAQKLGVAEVVTPYAPVGLRAWALDDLSKQLERNGIRLVRVQRDWDRLTWPLATGGFFKLKERLPQLITKLVTQ